MSEKSLAVAVTHTSPALVAGKACLAPTRNGSAGASRSPLIAVLLALLVCPTVRISHAEDKASNTRLRVIVETDAGADPDDEQSMVRFLLYTNEWDVEGIIANLARARDGENLNPERTGLGIVRRMIRAYGECYPSLVKHDKRYPKPETLLKRTVAGYDDVEDGVNLLIAAVDAKDARPVWFLNWGTDSGGAKSCLRRALDRILRERGSEGYARFKRKLRVIGYPATFVEHTTLDPPFPLLVDTFRPEMNGKRWYHRFSGITATAGGFDLRRDVLTAHGPLGALYPTNTTHTQKEGDTMTFLYLVPTGMNDPNQPALGSWAGRHDLIPEFQGRPYYWASQVDTWEGTTNRDNILKRWAADLQNDFRARMEWCVKPFREANHPPVVRIKGNRNRPVMPGDTVTLDASGSRDPDGNTLSFEWSVYPETGTGEKPVMVDSTKASVRVTMPAAVAGTKVPILLTVRDNGSPPLTRYGRVFLIAAPD